MIIDMCFDEIGFNLKPLEIQAAIGLEQLNKLAEMDSARRKNFTSSTRRIFSKYDEYFMLPSKQPEKSDPCWFGFLMTVKDNNKFKKARISKILRRT